MATIEDLDLRLLEQRKGFATEQTLEEIKDLLDEKNKPQGGLTQANVTKQTTKQTKELGSSIARMHPVLGMVERGFNALGNAISGTAGLVMSVAQADGSFKSLIPVVDQAADMLGGFLGKIPIVGGLFGGISDATAEFTKLRLALMDMQVNTFRTLSRAGLDASSDMTKMQVAVLKSNISMAEFEAILSQANNGVRVWGGTIDDGIMGNGKFLQTINMLTSTANPLGKSLAMMGLSSEQVVDEFAQFLDTNRFNLRMMSMETKDLTKAMEARLKNERIIAELTGVTVDEQRKNLNMMTESGALEFSLQNRENASQIKDFGTNLSILSDVLGEAFISSMVTQGGLTSDLQGMFDTVYPNLGQSIFEFSKLIESGSMTADEAFAKFTDTLVDNVGTAGELGTLSIFQGGEKFKVFDDFYKKIQQIDNQMSQAGYENFEDFYRDQKANLDFVTDGTTKSMNETQKLMISARSIEEATAEFQAGLVNATKGLDGFITDLILLLDDVKNDLIGGVGSNATQTTRYEDLTDNANLPRFLKLSEDGTEYLYGGSAIRKREEYFKANPDQTPVARFFGGGLFPGMTALIGEAGPELVSMGNSFGEVMSSSETKSLFGDMKNMMDSMMPALQSGDLSGVMNQMETMKPQLESSLKTVGGQIESKVGESPAIANLQSTMTKANMDFQKESVNYAAQSQQTLMKIEKLLKQLLPNAIGMY